MKPLVRAALLVIFSAALSAAHDPLQSNVVGRLRPDGVEWQIMMARSAADLLLKEEGSQTAAAVPSEPEVLLKSLKARASALIEMGSADETLALRDASVAFTVENDVEFHVYFPRPAAGKLSVRLPYLKQMEEGHCATLILLDESNKVLAVADVWPEQPALVIAIPPPLAK